MRLNGTTGISRRWTDDYGGSGRTHSHIGPIEEQAHHEDDGHPPRRGYQPEGEHAFRPAAFPGHSWASIGKPVGDPTIREGRFLAAHGSGGASVEEVAREQHTGDKHQQQPQIEAGAVEFHREIVGIGIALKAHGLTPHELHRSQGSQEKYRGDAEGVNGKPAHRENRVVARRGGSSGLSHGLFQAQVKGRFGVVTLAHHGGLLFLGLEVGIGTGGSEGVVGQARGHEQEPRQEDRRQGDRMDDPVADARNDLEKRAFTRRAGSHSSKHSAAKS